MRVESLERWWMPERWVFLQGLGIKGKGQVATTWLSLRAGSSPGLPCRQAPSSHLLPLRCTLEMILHTSTSPQQAPFTSSCPDPPTTGSLPEASSPSHPAISLQGKYGILPGTALVPHIQDLFRTIIYG